ncbi:Aldehyde/histidinol dehydrogenase [Suillus subalutaceus]|uniref:Aldehyde/histidinol dehydrogenase n=1 Tax=Suillus subalutaceus TaxID=48586 RepID=UPI001B864ACD|nr:Aldehyde/histidinol dehydrogenase [Suillus subalutaceus]KAG1837328.1 Aldehyde/histidinol dehydrogenase [Suillus subalutaceus]
MPSTFAHEFNTPTFKAKVSFSTGLFINGQFLDGSDNTTIDVINPTNGKVITSVSEGTPKDVDLAVDAAHKAFDTTWGLHAPGAKRSILMSKLVALMEKNADELAASRGIGQCQARLSTGQEMLMSLVPSIVFATMLVGLIRLLVKYKRLPRTSSPTLATEPIGVVGQIIPWNFPFNVLCGYGNTVGNAISSHMKIEKVAFTGSTLVGRKIMEAAAKSNLKNVTLELGGKSPNIIFDDADIEQAVNWAAFGIFWNHGQTCCAGSRIYVQEGIHDEFLKRFTEKTRSLKVGDPFAPDTFQGPQVSEVQFNRIMSYIESGKSAGAKVEIGGERHGSEGYFIKPTIFTNTHPSMKIVQEEIFGPVGVVIKFKDEEDVIKQANDTVYGLAAAVFTQNLNRAINTAHRLKAGTAWINCVNSLHSNVPFGGFKQSGIGRELGEYALSNYTSVKAVHVNLGHRM